jgi:hypothetical protein
MTIVAEQFLDLSYTSEKVLVRLYVPEQAEKSWVCRFEIGDPIDHALDVHGTTSLQALALALSALSAVLYSTDLYRTGHLGAFGAFGGYLGIPAPDVFLAEAPYPF